MPDAWFRSGAFPTLNWFSVGQSWSRGFHPQGNLTGMLPQITGGAMLQLRACPCTFGSPVLYEVFKVVSIPYHRPAPHVRLTCSAGRKLEGRLKGPLP